MSFKPESTQQPTISQNSVRPDSSQQHDSRQMSFRPDTMQHRDDGDGGQKRFMPETTQRNDNGQMSFKPDTAIQNATGQTSFSSSNAQSVGSAGEVRGSPESLQLQTSFGSGGPATSSTSSTSFGPMGGMSGIGGMGGMGAMGGMGCMGALGGIGMDGMGMMGGGMVGMGGCGGSNEAVFRAALCSGGAGQPSSQLMILLPAILVHQSLVPHGHLADIAQKCQVRVDLGADVSPGMLQVTLSGPVTANSMAAYFLQERSMMYGGCTGGKPALEQGGRSAGDVPLNFLK